MVAFPISEPPSVDVIYHRQCVLCGWPIGYQPWFMHPDDPNEVVHACCLVEVLDRKIA